MKAIILKQFGGVENFEMRDVTTPKIKDDEVLVRIKAIGFNPIDYQMRKGSKESELLNSPILGREFAGEVVKLKKNVGDFKPGDRVFAYVGSLASNGTYAEFIAVPTKLLVKIPHALSYEEVAGLPLVGLTALQCFQRINVSEKSKIFIAGGSGGVGLMITKMLIAKGAQNVYVTAGNMGSITALLNAGVPSEHIIDYTKIDILDYFKTCKNNLKFDIVIDLVGNHMSEICAELLDVFGTYVDIASMISENARGVLFDKGSTIHNISNYAPSLHFENSNSDYYRSKLNELLNFIQIYNIALPDINIVGNFDVGTVKMAHTIMENNKTGGKKLIMKF